jgi:hypothetical protein
MPTDAVSSFAKATEDRGTSALPGKSATIGEQWRGRKNPGAFFGVLSYRVCMFLSFPLVFLVVFAIFFYRAGEFEGGPSIMWAALSVAVSLATWRWLGWGLFSLILGQVALFLGITIVRAMRKS